MAEKTAAALRRKLIENCLCMLAMSFTVFVLYLVLFLFIGNIYGCTPLDDKDPTKKFLKTVTHAFLRMPACDLQPPAVQNAGIPNTNAFILLIAASTCFASLTLVLNIIHLILVHMQNKSTFSYLDSVVTTLILFLVLSLISDIGLMSLFAISFSRISSQMTENQNVQTLYDLDMARIGALLFILMTIYLVVNHVVRGKFILDIIEFQNKYKKCIEKIVSEAEHPTRVRGPISAYGDNLNAIDLERRRRPSYMDPRNPRMRPFLETDNNAIFTTHCPYYAIPDLSRHTSPRNSRRDAMPMNLLYRGSILDDLDKDSTLDEWSVTSLSYPVSLTGSDYDGAPDYLKETSFTIPFSFHRPDQVSVPHVWSGRRCSLPNVLMHYTNERGTISDLPDNAGATVESVDAAESPIRSIPSETACEPSDRAEKSSALPVIIVHYANYPESVKSSKSTLPQHTSPKLLDKASETDELSETTEPQPFSPTLLDEASETDKPSETTEPQPISPKLLDKASETDEPSETTAPQPISPKLLDKTSETDEISDTGASSKLPENDGSVITNGEGELGPEFNVIEVISSASSISNEPCCEKAPCVKPQNTETSPMPEMMSTEKTTDADAAEPVIAPPEGFAD